MKLIVLSHKVSWPASSSPTGYATDGGFPLQMRAISEIFDETTLIVTAGSDRPAGLMPLTGHNLEVQPLPKPAGSNLWRKISMLFWIPRHLPRIWRQVREADAVHAAVPGDVGAIGLLVALAQKKPLFVRHCGTWGEPVTVADRLLLRLLERVAGGRNVVMATGGAQTPPSRRNPAVSWIFSTSLSTRELESFPRARPWRSGEPLKLVTVGRLVPAKNTAAAVRALPRIREQQPLATLDVIGDGASRPDLEALASELGLSNAVAFHGNLPHDEVLGIVQSSHLFVFPTRVKEGFPKALLEAMASGLPVVATAVSVIPQLVGDRCGVQLHSTDPESVARAVLWLIEDEGRLAEMSSNGQQDSRSYTLERWGALIGERLRVGWRMPLRQASQS